MRKIWFLVFTVLLLGKDAGIIPRANLYAAVTHLHISYAEIFSSREQCYDIYIYSEGCKHCQSIREKMIARALDPSLVTLYFIPISKDMSFGHDEKEKMCCSCSLRVPGFPFVMRIYDGCLIERWLGALDIVASYLPDVANAGHQLEK